jgi:formylglycine-generating enzyme required for sulfatase activity
VFLGAIVFFIYRAHIFPEEPPPKVKKEVERIEPVKPAPVPVVEKPVLEIQTVPEGATVFIDGQKAGVTPLSVDDLQAGTHILSLRKRCYKSLKEEFVFGAGKTTLTFSLEPVCGNLKVFSIPSGADVIVNGKRRGVTPYQMTGVRLGEHDLRVHKGHVELGCKVRIRAGYVSKARFDFRRPQNPKPGTVWTEMATGMDFVWVPGGCYSMGNPKSDKLLKEIAEKENHKVSSFFKAVFDVVTDSGEEEEIRDFDIDEAPVHKVCVDGLWVARKEVTNEQYMQFSKATGVKPEWLREGNEYNVETGENEYYKTLGGASLSAGKNPVVGVSWHDVIAFTRWFGSETGYSTRLLREAEWEYVCRSGGQDEEFAGGSDVDSVAWYVENSDNEAHEVGLLQANGVGVFDFSGNVWEWTMDHYDAKAYAKHEQFNPVQDFNGEDLRMVVRGGSWRSKQKSLRCTARYGLPPDDTNVFLGFRIVMIGEKKK